MKVMRLHLIMAANCSYLKVMAERIDTVKDLISPVFTLESLPLHL
jgi:hypothetical protein